TKSSIFFYWLSLQDRGIDYDINKDIYAQTQNISLKDLESFFNNRIKGKKFNVGLIGNKDNLDWEAIEKMGKVQEVNLEERSEEHTSELQSRENLVCRLLLEKK